MQNKEYITVFTASMARQLLKAGYQIVDIKPDKTDKDNKRSLFIFQNMNGITDYISTHTGIQR